jgi:lysophospholipase L1-like esterase
VTSSSARTTTDPAAWDAGGRLTLLRRRAAGKLRVVPTALKLHAAARRGGPVELWIGDSHSMTFNRDVLFGMFMPAPDGQFVLRAGTRLMRSFARDGFGAEVDRRVRRVARAGPPGAVVPFFVAGEIDVRAHLPDHPEEDFAFVGQYVDRCRDVAAVLGAPRTYVVVPPPPSAAQPRADYPVAGTAVDRLAAFGWLRDALVREAESRADVVLVDATDLLGGPDGAIRPELTDDGCHTNPRGVALMRGRVSELLDSTAG